MQSYMGPIIAVTLIVLLAEVAMGRYRGRLSKRDWLVIGLPALLNPMVSRSLAGMLIAGAAGLLLPAHKGALAHVSLLPAYVVLLFVVEFCFYWGHRWAHEGQKIAWLGWLWKIHRTHHAGKYMNVLVTLRINLFWSLVVPTSWVAGFAIYLGQGYAAAMVILTIYGWNLITHANFRWDDAVRAHPRFGRWFRALEHVLVSPGIHHTHHGYGKDGATYRNYAVTFAFLDWMFGTLHIPEGRPFRYGLPGPYPHWAEEVFFPLYRARKGADEPAPAPMPIQPRQPA